MRPQKTWRLKRLRKVLRMKWWRGFEIGGASMWIACFMAFAVGTGIAQNIVIEKFTAAQRMNKDSLAILVKANFLIENLEGKIDGYQQVTEEHIRIINAEFSNLYSDLVKIPEVAEARKLREIKIEIRRLFLMVETLSEKHSQSPH